MDCGVDTTTGSTIRSNEENLASEEEMSNAIIGTGEYNVGQSRPVVKQNVSSCGSGIIPRPSRAREVVTPRGTNTGAVAHIRTSLKSERTALVCWGLKWEMK